VTHPFAAGHRLQLVADAAATIAGARNFDALRAAVCAACEVLFPHDLVDLAIRDETSIGFRWAAVNGSTTPAEAHYESAAREGRTILARMDTERSLAVVPVREGTHVRAILAVQRLAGDSFDSEDTAVLEALAALAACSLAAIRVFEDERTRQPSHAHDATLAKTLHDLSAAINQASTFDGAARACLRMVGEQRGWSRGYVWRRGDEGGFSATVVHDVTRLDPETPPPLPTARDAAFVNRVAALGLPGWLEAAPATPDREADVMPGAFAIPVAVRGESVAVLQFLSTRPLTPDHALEEFGVQLAAQLGNVFERERAEDRIRFQARMLEAVGQAVVASDAQHRVVYWNRAAEDLYGWSRAEALGRLDSDVLQARASAEQTAEITARLAAGQSWEAEFTVRRKDGTTIPVRITGAVIYDSGGAPIGYIGVATDLRRSRELEQQLRQAQKMEAVGRLAGGVAHDFNNLLTSIKGITHLLLEDLPADNPMRADLDEIRRAADRAATLTGQLLAFSRRQVLQPRVLDLNSLVRDLERSLQHLTGEHIALALDLENGIGQVRVDGAQLAQVIANLVANARDALPHGGCITLRTRDLALSRSEVRRVSPDARPGRYIMLEVEDNGVGIPSHELDNIFEPFFTTKQSGAGIGLGLSTAYGIVKQSDGYITAESVPGRGTHFRIFLPRMERAVHDGSAASALQVPRGGETVLLVEDEETVRKLARKILVRHGYQVVEASNGYDALQIWERHPTPIHLVITDVVMPIMGGAELIRRLRAIRADTPVLLMSGYTDDAIVRQSIASARDWFLEKPFTPDALARKVRAVLDAPAESDSM
jgi:PAS domain S-box-containing protein